MMEVFGMSFKDWDHLATTLGIMAAGVFFSYKAATGYQLVNLSMKVDCQRKSIPDSSGKDHLAVNITLIKGDRGTIRFRGGSVRLSIDPEMDQERARSGEYETGEGQYLPLLGLERFSYDSQPVPNNQNDRKYWRINWSRRSQLAPHINMSPGDEATLSAYGIVERGHAYKVDIVVIGQRYLSWRKGQWRATLISLPILPDKA
jgi:hypothetical protein